MDTNCDGSVGADCNPPTATPHQEQRDPIQEMNDGCSTGGSGGSDPLMLANRSAVTEPFTDIVLEGLRRLSISRTYSSADFTVRGAGTPGLFGRGWHHDWESQVHCIGYGGACQVGMGLGIWLDFRRAQNAQLQPPTVIGVGPYAGEDLTVYTRSEVEALGAGGQDLMLRRTNGEFILFLADGRELHFVPTANGTGCTAPDASFCFDASWNGRARLTRELDASGRAVNLLYAEPGAHLTLTDDLGNSLALKNGLTCPSRVSSAALNGVAYVGYEYHPGCDTLKRAYIVKSDGSPGPDLRAYDYQSTPGPGHMTTVRNAGGDAIAEFGYAANGDATSLMDRDSTIAVTYPDATHDLVTRSFAAGSSGVSTTRGGGGKAGVIQNDAYQQHLSWLGRFLRCNEDAQHHVRYFDRDAHHRVTRIAEYAPGTYSCQSASPPPPTLTPLREEWFEYGVQRNVAEATSFNPNRPTRVTRRSIHAGKPGAAADPFTSETFDFDRDRKSGDPVGYSCGGAGLPAGAVVCRRRVRGYSLDGYGNAVAEEHSTFMTYDERGRLTGSLGPIFTTGSAPLVNVDPVETRTYYADDDAGTNKRGRLKSITRKANAGQELTVTYDTWGAFGPQAIKDYNGSVLGAVGGTTTLLWDSQGRVEGVLTPDGRQVAVRYYDGQWPRLILLGSGAVRRFGYDGKGRVKTIEALSGDPDVPGATPAVGWTETRDYDLAGNATLITRKDATGAVVWKRERTHDAEHRPATEVHPVLAGVSASWAFDSSGFLESFTDEEGRVTGFTPDDLNRPLVVKKSGKLADGVTPVSLDVATYGYEPGSSSIQRVTDGAGRVTTYTHDDFGNVLSVTPDAATTAGGFTFSYDARGNVVSRSGGDSFITFTYDGLDRLTSLKARQLTANTSFTYSYVYDAPGQLGRLSSITEPDRATTFGYDAVGRLTSEVVQEGGVNIPLTTSYFHDADGDLQEVHSPAGLDVKYERDATTKAITEVRNVSNAPLTGTKYARAIKHLPTGPVTSLTFPSGETEGWEYNLRYEPKAYTTSQFSLTYTMNAAGNLGSNGSAAFKYDFLDRLTELSPSHGSETTSYSYKYAGDKVVEAWTIAATPTRAFSFSYDLSSNLSAVTTWSAAGVATGTTCLVHDALNRLTTVGPALALVVPGSPACKTDADLAYVTVRFKYDARNRRVARQDGAGAWKQWALLPDGSPLTELWRPTTSGGAWVKTKEYVWLEGRAVAQVEYPGPTAGGGYVYSVYVDHLGAPWALASTSNVQVWWAGTRGRPYGDVGDREYSSPDPQSGRYPICNLRLPGQYDERLFSTAGIAGLQGPYYNWNRWYLPNMGRYMEPDPIAVRGGFNGEWGPEWYAYLAGNPLSGTDPDGLEKLKICLAKKLLTLLSDDGKERMKADVVTGCTSTPTPTGKYRLGNWMKDPTTSLWGEDSKLKWSEDFWGRNVFGPWFVPLQNGDGVGIHGHYGPFTGDLGFLLGRLRSRCSHGCIRLSNDNITRLHDLLPKPLGTPVDITADCE